MMFKSKQRCLFSIRRLLEMLLRFEGFMDRYDDGDDGDGDDGDSDDDGDHYGPDIYNYYKELC